MNPSAVVVRLSAHSTAVRAMMDPLSAGVEECGGMWRNSNPHFSRCPSFEMASLQSEVIFQISHVELTKQRLTTRSRFLGTNEKAWSVFSTGYQCPGVPRTSRAELGKWSDYGMHRTIARLASEERVRVGKLCWPEPASLYSSTWSQT